MIDVVFSEIYSPVIGGAVEGRAAQARHICSREAGAPSFGCGPHGDADESRASERRAPQRDAGMLAGSRVSLQGCGACLQPARRLHLRLRPPGEDDPFETPEQSAEMAKVTVGDRGLSTPTLGGRCRVRDLGWLRLHRRVRVRSRLHPRWARTTQERTIRLGRRSRQTSWWTAADTPESGPTCNCYRDASGTEGLDDAA